MKLDPRVYPKPGDEIAREFATAACGCILRKVTRAHGGFVFYERDNGYKLSRKFESLGKWRKWASKATVVINDDPR